MATTSNARDIQKLYVEYFGRPADPAALDYWTGVLARDGAAGLTAMRKVFAESAEFTTSFAGMSATASVDQLFLNLFGRHSEAPGLVYYAGKLTSGELTISQILEILGEAAQGSDLAALNSKITAAEAFTAAVDTAAEINGYSGAAAAQLAKAYISSVTDAASLAAAIDVLPATIAQITALPQNHLPTGEVTVSGTAGVGQTLTVAHTLADAEGLGAVSYQWQAAGVNIAGATGSTLTLTDAQAGKPITVIASYVDGGGRHESVRSNVIASGDDTLKGTAGADTLAGSTGNDTYVVNVSGDVVVEQAGEGTDLVQVAFTTAGTYTLTANVEHATVTSAANIAVNLTGNALDNRLTGNGAANTLTGGAGNDTLDGGAGADKLIGGSGDDTYIVSESGDTVTELLNEGTDTVRTTLASHTLAANVENLVYTGAAAFTGTGNALNNIITGGNAGNKLDGGAGNDSLIGGNGADSLTGGLGNDTFVGATGKDTLDGGDGVDVLQGLGNFADYSFNRPNATDTVLTDKAGNVITVRGVESFVFADGVKLLAELQTNVASIGNDKLTGTDGDDTINGGAGADTMAGGTGDDTYVVDNLGDVITELDGQGTDLAQVALAAAGTYTLGSNVENATVVSAAGIAVNLTGNTLDNVLTGNAAANTLTGGAGNDTLDGGAGADKLIGGIGDDIYIVSDSGDTVTELLNEGTDTVRTTLASLTLAANVENLVYTGAAAFTGSGNALNNIITGGNAGNKLDGGAGNDSLTGGNGADSLTGGLGNDTFVGATGKDTLDGGDGVDVLQGLGKFADYAFSRPNATDTVLTDKAGNIITVRGVESFVFSDGVKTLDDLQYNIASVGNDKLYGTDGDDLLNGGLGADTLTGGKGSDTYFIDNVGDVIKELDGEGVDSAQVALTAAGTYTLGDYVEDATITSANTIAVNLTGNALDNVLTGNGAANTLIGGAGNDTLDGGAGADKLSGGLGDDLYIVADAGDSVTEGVGEGVDTVRTSLASYTLTANVENLRYTGSAAFTGTGNAQDNVITGGGGGNKLDGGAGNDTLSGGAGNDSLQGGLGDDVLTASAGKDTIDGGAGADRLEGLGKYSDYTITRPNGSDTVLTDKAGNVLTVRNVESLVFADGVKDLAQTQYNIASIANDELFGTDGNDTLDGGAGADTLNGGLGDDVYIVDNVGDRIVEQGSGRDLAMVALGTAATYVLDDGVEDAIVTATVAVNVTGNWMDNNIAGNAAANILTGGDGHDTLDGGAGADKLIGGTGDDVYLVADSGDTVTENADEGTDTVRTTLASYTLGANLENLSYTGKGAFSGSGNALDNVLNGGDGGAKLDGGAGNDLLVGGNGNDSLQGGLGDDTFYSSAGKDSMDGGAGDIDVLRGLGNFADYSYSRPNATDTVLTDKAGNTITVRNIEWFAFADGDKLLADLQLNVASVANDVLQGTDGKDILNGGLGADTMRGAGGDDIYVVDNVGDEVQEGYDGGADLVQVAYTAAGTYQLADFVENATVTAAAGVAVNLNGNWMDNVLTGNAAANTLNGGDGHDTLDGGAGADKLLGGMGDDVYIVDNAGDLVTENVDSGFDSVQTGLASYTLTANVENLNYSGTAAFTGTGNALDNVINGGQGGNKLDGGAGNDMLTGGAGNDSLQGGAGADTLSAAAGKDTVDGGADDDVLYLAGNFADYSYARPNATDLVLTDKSGNVLTVRNVELFVFADGERPLNDLQYNLVSPGNDKLYGGEGNDTINGQAGADTMTGYIGDDTYIVDNLGDQVVEGDGEGSDHVQVALTAAGTYTLADFVENGTVTAAASVAVNLNGNWMDNVLTGNAAANTLNGGDGHDTLDGGAGNDKLVGGTGDDVYIVADAGDVVVELADEGQDSVRTALASYTLGANVEDLRYTGKAAFSGTGNALANLIIGGDGGARLDGGAGNDTLFGGAGNDSLQGGLGDDVLNASGGKDSIDGGAGVDLLAGLGVRLDYSISRPSATGIQLTDKAGNVLTVSNVEGFGFADIYVAVDDLIFNIASPGADHLTGTAGDDTLDGGAGADTLSGGDGADTYLIDNVGDVIEEVVGGTGVDTALVALASAGTYQLNEQVENATVTAAASVAVNLTGNDLANLLIGNAAANALNGGAGDDTLDGGAGNDKLAGGSGDDWYVVSDSGDVVTELAGEGVDTVQTTLASYTLPVNVEILAYVGNGSFTGIGNALPNLMFAGNGGGKLDGGAGDDFLIGGAGNDSLQGGLGDDLFGASNGLDTIDGGAGYDELTDLGDYGYYMPIRINDSDIVLRNYAGQTITVRNVELFNFNGTLVTLAQLKSGSVGTGSDTVYGSSGNEILDGGPGNDVLVGGVGDDTYMLSAPGDVVIEEFYAGHDRAELAFAAAGTYTMAANLEDVLITGTVAVNVIGNDEDNYIIGNSANNNLTGGWGDDTLAGGGGNDTMVGGWGNDLYFVTEAGDVVTERADEGIDSVSTSLASYTLGVNMEILFYYGTGAFTGTGNSADNWLQAEFSSGAKLDGGAGNDTLIGSAGNDSLQGGAGDDSFRTGGGERDTIDGGAGADTLWGLAAFDSYTVSRPNASDTVLTDADGNVITVRNVETLVFADGTLTLAEVQDNIPSVGADHLHGGYASDTLDGGAGADTMEGLGGDDVYVVDNLNDKVVELADQGLDQVRLALTSAGTYVLSENVENAIIVSTAAVSITGNALNNELIGNAAANRLTGGAGMDTLDGGAGNDTLVGGAGDDLYYVADSGDVVTELLDEGQDLVLVTAASYTLAANVEDMSYTGTGSFKGTGNALDNVLINNGNGGTLDGGAGNDTLIGSAGNDSLLGGAGNDVIQVTAGNDTVDGGAGNDLLHMRDYASSYTVARPNATDLVLTDQLGNSVTLRNIESLMFSDIGIVTPDYFKSNVASSGNDVLLGTDGNDYINGLGGADDMTGGAGNDVYTVDVAGDVIHEAAGGGIDTVNVGYAGAATYVLPDYVENAVIISSAAINLTGNSLDNRLVGNAAANTLTGGNGDDTYVVGAGDKVVELANGGSDTVETALASYTLGANVENLRYTGSAAFIGIGNELANVLRGGAGADKLTGGGGSDTFVFDNLAASDTVTDFVSGTDRVQFSMAAFGIGNGDTTIDAAQVHTTPGGFSNSSELVLFTQRMNTASAANAAAIIGSADSGYGVGSTALFAVATSSATVLYRFVSANNDALVSAGELTQVAVLTGTPITNLDDFSFIA